MNENQRKSVAIIGLAELRGKELSDAATRIFVNALSDVPADVVEAAVARCAKFGGPHMESPADIRCEARLVRVRGNRQPQIEAKRPRMHYEDGEPHINEEYRRIVAMAKPKAVPASGSKKPDEVIEQLARLTRK